jgi:hypothetical protein
MKNYRIKLVKKFLPGLATLALILIFLTPYRAHADLCPVDMRNSTTVITLQNPDLTTLLPNGTYWMSIGWADDNGIGCFNFKQEVTITASSSLSSCVSTATGSGICITINPINLVPGVPGCNLTTLPGSDGLRTLYTSIIISATEFSASLLELNYTPFSAPLTDNCFVAVIPVTFSGITSSYTTSPSPRVIIDWTTSSESSLDHFSIEKSYDGSHFYKIGQVAATNTSSTHNYTFPDLNPIRNAYYRIASISIDCYRKYSGITANGSYCPINDQNCPKTFTPPNITQDCTPPNNNGSPYIKGTSPVCDLNYHFFRMTNVNGEATVTWSASPANVVTLYPIGRTVALKKTGSGSSITLQCTVVRYGVTTNYYKTITFNNQQSIIAYWESSYDGAGVLDPSYYHYDYVSPYSNVWVHTSIPTSQTWTVEDGSIEGHGWIPYIGGTGAFEFYMPPGGWGTVRITGNDAGYCPTTATFTFVATSGGRPGSGYFATSPSKDRIRIVKKAKALEINSISRQKVLNKQDIDKPSVVKVYDIMGNLRKTTTLPGGATTMDIDASNLPSGWYFVHIVRNAADKEVLKVWLAK